MYPTIAVSNKITFIESWYEGKNILTICGKINFINARRSENLSDKVASVCPRGILFSPLCNIMKTETLKIIEKTVTATKLARISKFQMRRFYFVKKIGKKNFFHNRTSKFFLIIPQNFCKKKFLRA